jgi:hypothetical protein
MRPRSSALPAMVMAVAMMLAAGGFAADRADASALRLAATGSPRSAGSTWGTAIEVPGTAALNKEGGAQIVSVSCATAGNCSAGGFYAAPARFQQQAFVVGETGGKWGTAIEVPGTAALNKDNEAETFSVSCATAGNCSAGGQYDDAAGRLQAFVASETGGKWGTAIEVPGTAALNSGGAQINSVSCRSAGNCSAGGSYEDASGHDQAFVVGETGGTWGNAIEVPGTAALNTGGSAGVTSVSCASAGNCSAGGSYATASGFEAFVAGESGGRWGNAIEVPGTAALNKGDGALVTSVSCATAGNCSAGGYYTIGAILGGQPVQEAFVAGESGGRWGSAIEVPGTAALNKGDDAQVTSVSCATAGNCSAGGYYTVTVASGIEQAFVVREAGGTWGSAIEVPGMAALNKGAGSQVYSVSCATAGNCSAGGSYVDSSGFEAFVVGQTGGTWGNAIEVPGIAALNKGIASINSVSCATAGNCSAGGYYASATGADHTQAFVVGETSSPSRASHK